MSEWNKGELDSFLIEITADILKYKDTDGQPLLDKIRDAAGQKGTGKWTAISALDYGVPLTLIGRQACFVAVPNRSLITSDDVDNTMYRHRFARRSYLSPRTLTCQLHLG